MTVVLNVVDPSRDDLDFNSWTVRKESVVAVSEAFTMRERQRPGYSALGRDAAKVRVTLTTGQQVYCTNDYRELCESLWPNSTGYVYELEQRLTVLKPLAKEAVDYLKSWVAEGVCDYKQARSTCGLASLQEFIKILEDAAR